jgi:hypothetical protein
MTDQDEEWQSAVKKIRAVMGKKKNPCPVVVRLLHGEGAVPCALEAGHEGEHSCLYTGNHAYLRRVAERVMENVCVRDGKTAWKSTEANLFQGWDDSLVVLEELIGVVLAQERETFFDGE